MLEVILAVAALAIVAAIVKQAGPEGEDSFYDLSDLRTCQLVGRLFGCFF